MTICKPSDRCAVSSTHLTDTSDKSSSTQIEPQLALPIASRVMSALHVFDMDGTLLRGTTASIELSRRLDRLEPLAALEAGFAAERISAAEFAAEMRALWTELSPELVAEVVSASPWIDGISAVCGDIADRGERSMLITMSPNFFAEHLLDFGIDVVAASQFPGLPFAEPIDPTGILEPADKVRLAEAERVAHGLMPHQCVAYGDSMSDLPLFGVLENTVAVNADEGLEQVAAVAYRGESLLEAYAIARELLDRPR
jgi:phosphoserine phosphatase